MPEAHSDVIGGSTAERRIQCAGSYQQELPIPDPGSSEFADEGTMLHDVMYKRLEGVQTLPGFRHPNGQVLTREQVLLKVEPAFEAWEDLIAMFDGPIEYLREMRVSLEAVIPGAFGTGDVLGVGTYNGKKTGIALDWKFGFNDVGAEGNMQAAFYALGATVDPDPELRDMLDGVEQWMFVIVQPSKEEPLDTWVATNLWLKMFETLIVNAHRLALTENPPLKAGSWCKWCRAKLICSEQTRLVGEAMSKAPELMTAVELAHWLEKKPQVLEWFKALDAHALAQAAQGAAIPGRKLVEKVGNRRWLNFDAVLESIRSITPSRDLAFGEPPPLSPAQLEKVVRQHATKEHFNQWRGEVLPTLTERPRTGTVLVADTDKRPALVSIGDAMSEALRKAGIES